MRYNKEDSKTKDRNRISTKIQDTREYLASVESHEDLDSPARIGIGRRRWQQLPGNGNSSRDESDGSKRCGRNT